MPGTKEYNYPINELVNIRIALKKEKDLQEKFKKEWDSGQHPYQDTYVDPSLTMAVPQKVVLPKLGQEVALAGMVGRPHLNGTRGKIIGAADEKGFYAVRIPEDRSATDAASSPNSSGKRYRKMMVRSYCLAPLSESASSPCLTFSERPQRAAETEVSVARSSHLSKRSGASRGGASGVRSQVSGVPPSRVSNVSRARSASVGAA
eukprot:gnl/TRDRNA2_/TRDRNA2_35255_c0_seq1.p1 gnl/TRDRNA2_/TRDRNA2_35255_c0~~gnl/TRDRNA2_/TRDRNA2_35255_c0_seq1.p1  ORF type:complete len:205 (-),score=29.92 gnl/TRDRNA2_/TRDRNA2_35255_c0_seq1:143-757(-)